MVRFGENERVGGLVYNQKERTRKEKSG